MKRRSVIQGLMAAPVMAVARQAVASTRKPLLLVLHGVGLDTPAERLFAVIDPIVSMGFPLAVAVDPAARGAPQQSLKTLFAGLTRDYSGLVELCIGADPAANGNWYRLARQAGEAQSGFLRFAASTGVPASWQPRLTLLTGTSAEYSGVRTAGFRVVLMRPLSTGPVRTSLADTGVLTIGGGLNLGKTVQPDLLADAIAAALATGEVAVLYLDMAAFDGLDRRQAFEVAAKVAAGLGAEGRLERARPILPSEFAVQYSEAFTRMLAIRIEAVPPGHAQHAAQLDLIAQLRLAGIPLTITVPGLAPAGIASAELASGVATAFCLPIDTADDAAATLASQLAQANQAFAQSGLDASCVVMATASAPSSRASAEAGVAIMSPTAAFTAAFVGLDDNAMLHVPVLCQLDAADRNLSAADVRAKIVESAGNLADAVISVQPGYLSTPPALTALRDALVTLSGLSSNRFVTVSGFAKETLPADRALELLRKVRRGRMLASGDARAPDEAERARLLDDAKLAWRYSTRFADKKTGFPPASAWADETGYSAYPYVTMWDCGSALLALVAAHSLKLIDSEEFNRRASAMIAALHAGDDVTGGLRLPKAYMSVTGSGKGDSGYDASDMGRLLVALKTIEVYTGGQVDCSETVAGWDLAKTVVMGRIHNLKNGKLVDVHHSAYANYAVRGFQLWGYAVGPAFGVPVTTGSADELLRVLEAFSISDPVGAEPHVLEEVELGHSHVSRLISDVLYQAQIERFNATGRYTCASEGPLDREPWFTYQGYQILAEGDPWTIGTVVENPRYQTEGFRLANEIISTKSAFMWAGVRPETYSRNLLDYVRARGKVPNMGFTSGIFAATGRAMQNYSDINTNAEILEAVAYVLGGNTPLHRMRMARKA